MQITIQLYLQKPYTMVVYQNLLNNLSFKFYFLVAKLNIIYLYIINIKI